MPSLNFKKCLDAGVADTLEQLRIISENAWEEYLIEMAVNKMLEEWDHIKFELIPYENTGIYIVKLSDEEIQMLNDHVMLVQKLSTSLFRKEFEEQLPQWEEDLRFALDIISTLDKYQKYNKLFLLRKNVNYHSYSNILNHFNFNFLIFTSFV